MKRHIIWGLSIGAFAGLISSLIIINTGLVSLAGFIIENGIFAGRYQNYGYISATQATQDNYVWIVIVTSVIALGIIGLIIGLITSRNNKMPSMVQ